MGSDPHIIIDAHLDIAYNVLRNKRNFMESVYAQRVREAGRPIETEEGSITVALPQALLGRVGIVFGTLFVSPAASPNFTDAQISYSTPREAYQRALAQLDVYQRLADEHESIVLIRTQAELTRVLASWETGKEFADHRLGVVLSMEGADPILEPQQFEEWYERGIRAVGLAWGETRYSAGTGHPGPLTDMGRELMEIMADFKAILDVSHMAQEAFFEALDRYEGTIIASHSNPRRFVNGDRHLSDDMIRRLAERDGVMGVVLYNRFLKQDWVRSSGSRKNEVTLDNQVIAAIDHICQITGSAQHVGIGSDLDGGFGLQSAPAEIDTLSDILLIETALRARGYAPTDIASILHGNFLRILRRTLPI